MIGLGEECSHCGWSSPTEARYCGRCGHTLDPLYCQTCFHRVAATHRFCGTCGSSLVESTLSPSRPEEQLRQVTVLFALMSGLQTFLEQSDPESFKELLDECFGRLTAEIVTRGGIIDKYMADSLMALFGVPVAHENDPDRAVAAALGMLDAIERINQSLFQDRGIQIGLKIGINTGKVLVGYVGSDSSSITVMGDVVNTASRVEHAAAVGSILICDSTRRGLTSRYALRSQPPLVVKGKSQPLRVFRVLRQHEVGGDSRPELSQLPLVGREPEFDRLVAAWRQVMWSSGRDPVQPRPGGWLSLLGDVGLGKERLLQEFQQYLRRDPSRPRVVVTRGASLTSDAPAQVLGRLVAGLAGGSAQEGIEAEPQRLLELARLISGVDDETGESIRPEVVVQSIQRLLGRSVADDPVARLPGEKSRDLRHLGITYLIGICARLAADRPLVILARELQWAEEVALDFFEALGAALPARVLLLTSARPSLLERRKHWGRSNLAHQVVQLAPLTLRDTQLLVQAMIGTSAAVSPRMIESLHQFTGGNPFYLAETLRHYLETRSDEEGDAAELAVPDSIEGVIQSRLDRLPFEDALTLRAAAIMGPTFWRGAVEAALESTRLEELERLSRRGFIRRQPRSSLVGEDEYNFDHVLIARVAAGNLLESVRRRYHQAYAVWLSRRTADSFMVDRSVAHHYEAAGELSRAIPFFVRAGDRALSAYDCTEAIRLYDRALEDLEVVRSDLDPLLIAHLFAQRGEARRMTGDNARALDDFRHAAEAAQQIGDQVAGASAWYRIGLVHLALGDNQQALSAATAGDRMLQGQTAPSVEAVGLHLRAELLMDSGEPFSALPLLERAIQLWRRTGDRWGLAHGLNTMGRLLAERSELMAARNAFRESASIRELLGDVNGLATTLHNLGSVADRLGQFPEALGHYHRSLRLNRRMGNTSRMAATLMNQGAGYMRCGYYGRARVALEEALDLNEAQKRTWWYAACLGNLGQLWVRVGRLPDAVTCLQESSQLFLDSESWEWRAESLVDLAAARLLVGAFDDAETLLNDAFECSTRYPGSETEARVLILFAQLALARQNIVDARQRIEELEWNDAAQVTPELRVECALLDGHLGLRTGRLQLAQSRLEEANRVAREHDLAPGLWRAKAALSLLQVRQGRSGKGQTEEALRELVARVEDPELMRAVQNSLQLEWRRYGVPTSSLET